MYLTKIQIAFEQNNIFKLWSHQNKSKKII